MLTLHFKNGKTLEWLDMTEQLIDSEMLHATIENPVRITFHELPKPIFEQIPYEEGTKNYYELQRTMENVDFAVDEYSETPIYYELTTPELMVKCATKTFEPSENWNLDEVYVTDDERNIYYNFTSGISFWLNDYGLGYDLFTGGGGFYNASGNRLWGYIGQRGGSFQHWDGTVMMPTGGYTYMAKYNTTRTDYNGKVILNFGICIITSPTILETGKEYKCLTTAKMRNTANRSEEYGDGWININYVTYDEYLDIHYDNRRGINYNSSAMVNKKYFPPYFSLSDLSYEDMESLLWVIGIEGAIMNSSNAPERRRLTLANISKTGLYTLYCTDNFKDVVDLNSSLWSTAEETAKSNYNILSSVLSFGFLPMDINPGRSTDVTGELVATSEKFNINVGGRNVPNVTWYRLSKQYIQYVSEDIYYEGIYIDKPWHYLDFAPYSSAFVTLPYIGTEMISPSDFMSRLMKFEYTIDCFSGLCTCRIWRTKRTDTKSGFDTTPPTFSDDYELISEFTGSCLINLPLSSNNWHERNLQELSLSQQGRRALYNGISSGLRTLASGLSAAGGNIAGLGGAVAGYGGMFESYIAATEIEENESMLSYPSSSVSYGGSNQSTAGVISNQDILLTIKYPNVDDQIGEAWAKYHGYQTMKDVELNTIPNNSFVRVSSMKTSAAEGATLIPDDEDYSNLLKILSGGVFI